MVFPGGVLPLRIFEPRYLDMVSHCMREASSFVICAAQAVEDGGRDERAEFCAAHHLYRP